MNLMEEIKKISNASEEEIETILKEQPYLMPFTPHYHENADALLKKLMAMSIEEREKYIESHRS